ncbi:MAG: type III pantothenate kinase [Deltaproteobacteria bacterium]|nr:MAG: type III pantothenate kinase [Deltaproteobacteria bacterium]
MILVIDVGNTNIVLGIMDGEEVARTFRVSTTERTTDETGVLLLTLLGHVGFRPGSLHGAIIASVVPSVQYSLEKALRRYLDLEPLVVGRGVKTGMKIRTDNPREVGADRIVNAVAAWHRYGGPVIIVDFGTATTVDCVNDKCEYVGGAIAPGLQIAEEALFSRTAKLPRVEVARPKTPIGTNTVAAIQSGLFWGYVGLVDNLVRRCQDTLGGAEVVATGGLSNLIAPEVPAIGHVDGWLTLRGLAQIYARNADEA